ncbi:MAG: ECF-type sigma factor [Planctomycetota bacterium]
MNSNESVTAWIEQLKDGESFAAQKLWSEYVERLVGLAHRKLGDMPKRVVDAEDVVLSAFRHFLDGVKEDRFAKLDDRQDLWSILVMLTERRAIGQRRFLGAQKRGGGNVRGESILGDADGNQRGLDAVAELRDATPEFAVEFAEELRVRLAKLGDERQRSIVLGKLEGKTNSEIARELSISVSSVERKLSIIRDSWREALQDG